MEVSRRRLFGIGAAFVAAPAIVRVASIMPVSVLKPQGFIVMGHLTGVYSWFNITDSDLAYLTGYNSWSENFRA